MSKHHTPPRPGNDFTHPTFWDTAEKVIFYALVPLGSLVIVGMLIGLIASAVTS